MLNDVWRTVNFCVSPKLIKVVNNKTPKGRFASQFVTADYVACSSEFALQKARWRLTCIMFTDFDGEFVRNSIKKQRQRYEGQLLRYPRFWHSYDVPNAFDRRKFQRFTLKWTNLSKKVKTSAFSSLFNAYCGYDGVRSHLCQLK